MCTCRTTATCSPRSCLASARGCLARFFSREARVILAPRGSRRSQAMSARCARSLRASGSRTVGSCSAHGRLVGSRCRARRRRCRTPALTASSTRMSRHSSSLTMRPRRQSPRWRLMRRRCLASPMRCDRLRSRPHPLWRQAGRHSRRRFQLILRRASLLSAPSTSRARMSSSRRARALVPAPSAQPTMRRQVPSVARRWVREQHRRSLRRSCTTRKSSLNCLRGRTCGVTGTKLTRNSLSRVLRRAAGTSCSPRGRWQADCGLRSSLAICRRCSPLSCPRRRLAGGTSAPPTSTTVACVSILGSRCPDRCDARVRATFSPLFCPSLSRL
mmetsp:Transcript_5762/g.14755  ORF Transcript_5762/g.14755 Transcript_5762/m.14755 type:complete len:330 (+) Transcript_5762:461-1450(+)